MPSEQEIQFHRSFLKLNLCLSIWNEDYRYQNTPGGPPDRQKKVDSDPVFAYHVHTGPHWPSKPPGDTPDRKYNALLARSDGGYEPLVIITKRGGEGQRFASAATPWELIHSVLCGGKFTPVVNSMMEVTGHYALVPSEQLIHPEGINFGDPSEYITNEVPLILWMGKWFDGKALRKVDLPPGWAHLRSYGKLYFRGMYVLVLPNGEVIGVKGHYDPNHGSTYSVISPLDFWAPGSRFVSVAIRGVTNRIGRAATAGYKVLTVPTKSLAESTLARLAPKTLPGVACSTRGMLPAEMMGKRAIIMGDDMPVFKPLLARNKAEDGFYDIVIHGDPTSFYILEKGVWKTVSVREVANAVRPFLEPKDKSIRLLACSSASKGGPAQELANLLKRTVWAPSKSVYPVHGMPIKDSSGKLINFTSAKSFVPDGGVFYQFDPGGGSAILSGPGKQVNQHVVKRTK